MTAHYTRKSAVEPAHRWSRWPRSAAILLQCRPVARKAAETPKPEPEKNYITPSGFRALQGEFEHLRVHKRREVVIKLSEAAAEGDRSENAEYIYRKRQLRDIDRRIRFLVKRMALAEVIDPSQHRSDKICFGARVKLEDESGKTLIYQIVGVDESDPKQGRISWRSPLGRALIGRRVEDEVTVQLHAGQRDLVVLAIDFPRQESAAKVVPDLATLAAENPGFLADDDEDEGDDAAGGDAVP